MLEILPRQDNTIKEKNSEQANQTTKFRLLDVKQLYSVDMRGQRLLV